jgi:subtilisin family serine protease
VAVIDSGVRYTHEDLAANMWHNPGEASNGIDDDGDGYVDDIYGINTIQHNGNPFDDYGHGTHVAGLIGAKGFNGVGVVGVCWSVQIMACKFIDSLGNGSISDAITCIDYARSKGARIINFSWGDTTFTSQALYDAIASARNAGIIFTAACGNNGANNDVTPYYPASYDLDNILSVAATTRRDELASYSSYGQSTVDLGAPGDTVFSCWYSANNSYRYLSGTSMAAPIVAGACALLWAYYPQESYSDIIHRILWNVDPLPQLAGKCVSGGRLNLLAALLAPSPTQPPTVTVTASDPVATIGTSDTGTFTFSRDGDTSAPLTISYQLGGSAVSWDDYRRPQGDMPVTVTIPAGAASTAMIIEAIGNETGANPETVVLTLSNNPAYVVGSSSIGTITIHPTQALVIQGIQFTAPASVTLNWSSISGGIYQVQYATSFPASTWQTASGVITATNSITTWTGNVYGIKRRFYRVTRTN